MHHLPLKLSLHLLDSDVHEFLRTVLSHNLHVLHLNFCCFFKFLNFLFIVRLNTGHIVLGVDVVIIIIVTLAKNSGSYSGFVETCPSNLHGRECLGFPGLLNFLVSYSSLYISLVLIHCYLRILCICFLHIIHRGDLFDVYSVRRSYHD
jgi:hypothetical protein